MADEADCADKINTLLDGAKIKEIRAAAQQRELQPTGQCHNCEHVFPDDDPEKDAKLWCDGDCQEDWQKREWAKRQR